MKPMKAGKAPPMEQIRLPACVSPKLDGIRALCNDTRLLSKSLKPIPNVYIQKALSSKWLHGLDGELISGSPTDKNLMQATSSCVMSRNSTAYWDYHVFDLWHTPEVGFRDRLEELKNFMPLLQDMGLHNVHLVPHTIVDSVDELKFFEEQCLEQGYEGVMVRSLLGRYKYGRSTVNEGYLLKLKRFVDSEIVITGFEPKLHNANVQTRNELGYAKRSSHKENLIELDTLGVVLGTDLKSKKPVRVGGGFTDELRKHIWDNRKKYLGKIMTYTYFPHGVKDLARHTNFKAFRDKRDM